MDATTPSPRDPVLSRRGLLLRAAAGAIAIGVAGRAGPAPTRAAVSRAHPERFWRLPAHDLHGTRRGGPVHGYRERWRRTLEGGVTGAAAITPAGVLAASLGGEVACFDLEHGRERWRRAFRTATYGSAASERRLGFFGGIAVRDGRVFAASDRVVCLDAASGTIRWRTAPLRTDESDDYFWGPPVAVGGLVLVGSGSGAEEPTARGRLTAYAGRDGRLVWSTPMVPEGGNGGGVIAPATVDRRHGIVYVATGSPYARVPGNNPGTSSLVALSVVDGSILWQDQVYPADERGFDFNSAAVVLGSLLVATSKNGVHAWDRRTRERLWHRRLTPAIAPGEESAGPTSGPEGGPLATDGSLVYALSNDAARGACVAAALEPTDGDVVWRRRLPSFSFAAPAVTGRALAVPGADGVLRVLATGDGTTLAEAPLGEPSSCPPVVAQGRLVVGTGAEPFLPGRSLVCLG